MAAVVVSAIHLSKGKAPAKFYRNRLECQGINSFLLVGHEDCDPLPLRENNPWSYRGHVLLGMGFTFADNDEAAGGTLLEMKQLLANHPECNEIIHPYLGGSELNTDPGHHSSRYAICFRGIPLEEAAKWPAALAIVENKVKPDREKLGGYSVAETRRRYWWQYGTYSAALQDALAGKSRYLALSRVSVNHGLAFIPSKVLASDAIVAFPFESYAAFAILQSRTHEIWARLLGSTMKDDLRYTSSDCFDTFPFAVKPSELDCLVIDRLANLDCCGNRYYLHRAAFMKGACQGLTSTYNSFHDPSETGPSLLELRRLHDEMDQAVLEAYDWCDVATVCGFGLDYLDLEDDAQLSDNLQDRIDSGELFFWEPDEACAFEDQVRAYGAVKGKKKFPWRYRWPDDVRDDVLARLLALNAERYGEEVAQGLHSKSSKSSKKASGPAAPGAKRRGLPPKSAQAGETGSVQAEQIGLGI